MIDSKRYNADKNAYFITVDEISDEYIDKIMEVYGDDVTIVYVEAQEDIKESVANHTNPMDEDEWAQNIIENVEYPEY